MERLSGRIQCGGASNDTGQNEEAPEYNRRPQGAADKGQQNGAGRTRTPSKSRGARAKEWKGQGDGMPGRERRRGSGGDIRLGEVKGAGKGNKDETKGKQSGKVQEGGGGNILNRSRESRSGGEGRQRERGGFWRREHDANQEKGARSKVVEKGERRGAYSVDRRGGGRGETKNYEGDKKEASRDRSAGKGGAPRHSGMGYKSLEELSNKDPSVVAITLSSNPGLRTLLGETTMRKDLVELLCLVLSMAFKSRADRSTLQHLGRILKDSGFLRSVLPLYLAGMGSEVSLVRMEQYPRQLGNILTVLSEVLSIFPASSILSVSLLLTQFQAAVNTLRALGVDIQPEVEENMENLQGLVKHLQEKSREGTLRSDKDTYSLLPAGGNEPDNQQDGQQDFRTIPIYPTPEELHQTDRPFLRPNLTSQRYTNAHIYLDTHFRLLREDFVKPLRDGIQELIFNQMNIGTTQGPSRSKRFDDIRIYFDTQLMVPQCTHTGISYIIQFDIQPLKFVRWENSKRLIFGSLVCLSCDNFETFLFATVSDRKPSNLQKGQVQITFTEESRFKLARVQKDQKFLMVETTAYFEAYRYVLEGLQEQEEGDLPFQRYIVDCNPNIQPPAYLRRRDVYDLSHIADPAHKHSLKPFHSLDEQAWPKMEKLGLDESQMRALKLALTKELAIIQGPPGTGKTYVGLKISEALLTNENLWKNPNDNAPILVVCYTNHALDQFLEGIHRFLPRGIVRVGGRSSSEILKQFNLSELTHSKDFRQSLPRDLRDAFNNIYRQLCDEQRELQSQSVMLECSLKGVLRQNVLQKYISETHWDSLHIPPREDGFGVGWERKKSNLMMDWLGLGSTVFLQRETEDGLRNEEEAAEETMEADYEDLIEIAEEADLIEAERIIEDYAEPRGGEDGRQRADGGVEAVKAVEKMMLAMNLDEVEIQAEDSEEGWEMQRDQKKKMKNKIRKELAKGSTMKEEEEKLIFDIWTLSQPHRWRLYRLWVARYRIDLRTKAMKYEQDYQITADRLAEVKRHQNICLLKRATVIGMTTTGAAKYRQILQEVHPTLVIVEEAAEVLEAHTITSLSKACQHLILIGDHQQLRPSATVFELAKNFHLEMSMFERLVKMGLPFVRLNYQHRMRPDIARLLTPHIYSELENHPSVFNYDNIKGLNANLFFLEHNHPEEEIKDGKSHQNRHEATFVVELCRYLLLQEYKPEKITILTTYTGQLHCLRKLMPASQFSGVKVHVVDKYQGEENDIVLLSLVRSNLQGKVGFLNIPNRVCVALSRAKKGLYCVGNRAMLSQVKLWSNIFHILSEKQQIGKALTLCCQNHPSRQVNASCAKDFKEAPEGGCTQPCEFRLDCGHVCSIMCHPYDAEHKEYKCGKKCQKILCEMGHRCTLVCHQPCPKKCPVKVEKTIPRCQHKQIMPCHQDPGTFACLEPCQKTLQCGHACDSLCGSPCTSKCEVKVTLDLKCGHSQDDCCFYKTQNEQPKCRTPCKLQLTCGHTCKGNCAKCYQGRFHSACSHKCERLLICSHKCTQPCTRDCPPCQHPCENRCIHSKCCKPCGQPCAPCIEPCTWQCPHQSCSKLCHEPCDRPPCTEPCAKFLECGHPCIGLCGDKCPTKCRICNREEVTEIFFGTEDDPEAYFIELEDCGHIIESTAMDIYMGMDENQQVNGEEVAINLKKCPRCRTPIRKNLRYGTHINRCLAEIEMVKEKINGPQTNIEMYKKALQKQWKENALINEMPLEYMDIAGKLNGRYLTANDLSVLENRMDFLTRVGKLLVVKKKNMSDLQGSMFMAHVQEFVYWLSNKHQKYTEQQVFDLQRELRKLTILAEFNAHCHKASQTGQSGTIQFEVQRVKQVLSKCGQFTEQDEDRVKVSMQELKRKIPLTGLGISDEERKMIVSAMNMSLGHWHKCPNGHVYVIGDCGGAMESRRCPDCTATIGGGNHTLASGNQVASEMDGAQHPAWSEANNLLNFGEF